MRSKVTKRWSKLQSRLYNVRAARLDFQIHCASYPMDSRYGQTSLPRYWITLDKEIIWDYPKDFLLADSSVGNLSAEPAKAYPYQTDISAISDLITAYLATPREELLTKTFQQDYWGLINILRAADRRIGKRGLLVLKRKTHNQNALKLIQSRLG